ncbi:hypothetical protein ABBZ51_01090 [Acinetobacter baumannii]|uniref:hypothetical protein n=1 Tax=Acinetobacter baumannii TaxID=470 RepID=UPI00385D2B98
MPKITYSGSQAAFSFDGIQVGQGRGKAISLVIGSVAGAITAITTFFKYIF